MLLRLGVYSTSRTATSTLLGLVRELRPQDCGKNLIRIGAPGDGGYLIPDDLEGINYCFSPGVSTISDFENDLADLGIKCFLADYSVDAPPILRREFTFDKRFVGASDFGNYFTLSNWKDKYLKGYSGDMLLQMDIEGNEYEVIFSTPDDLLNQFRIMAIEFHYLDRLFDPVVFSMIAASFRKILQQFHVAHIHPNEIGGSCKVGDLEIPKVMEFTFLNKRRVSSTNPIRTFPHKLDSGNTGKRPLTLPACWYI